MKGTDRNAVEIYNCGGAVAAGDWKRGSGNYVSSRPVPQKCVKITSNSDDIMRLPNPKSREAAAMLLIGRPKVRKLIVVKDWEEVEKLALVSK